MLNTIKALGPSIVRTVTPIVVGVLVTLLARVGFEWTPSPEAIIIVSAGVSSVWYVIVRLLETRGRDAWGWLLGLPSQPQYVGRRRA